MYSLQNSYVGCHSLTKVRSHASIPHATDPKEAQATAALLRLVGDAVIQSQSTSRSYSYVPVRAPLRLTATVGLPPTGIEILRNSQSAPICLALD